MPDAGLSAGIGSDPTETICVIRLSASVLGEMAASILAVTKETRGDSMRKPVNASSALDDLRSQIELSLYDGVDVSPDHA